VSQHPSFPSTFFRLSLYSLLFLLLPPCSFTTWTRQVGPSLEQVVAKEWRSVWAEMSSSRPASCGISLDDKVQSLPESRRPGC